METIIERLDIFKLSKGLSDNKFQKICGLSSGVLKQARKNCGNLSRLSMEKIYSAFPELNRVWVETGDGDMVLAPTITNTNSQVIGSNNTGSSVHVDSTEGVADFMEILIEQQRQNAETQRQNAKMQSMMEKFLELIDKK